MSQIAAVLEPRSVLIASDFSQPSEKALRNSLALARLYGSRICLAHVVSSLGLTMAGPVAIAACEEAVLRKAAQLEASLVQTGALTGIQYKFILGRVNCGQNCEKSSEKKARISSSSAHMDDTAWARCSSVQSRKRFSVRQAARS